MTNLRPLLFPPRTTRSPSLMPLYRFTTLLLRDAAGFHTALPVEAEDAGTAGFGRTAAVALDHLRDYLTWLYRRDPYHPAPGLCDPELSVVKAAVRPEYRSG